MPEDKFYFTLTKYLSYIAHFGLLAKSMLGPAQGDVLPLQSRHPTQSTLQRLPTGRHMTDIQMLLQHLSSSQNFFHHMVHKEEISFGRKKAEFGQNESKSLLITLIRCDSRKL